MLSLSLQVPPTLVSFPDRIFRARWKNGSGQLPIPFSFKCAGMLAHCSFLIGASVSEPLFSDVYVDFVCHGPSSGIATAHASYFLHMDCTAWQRRMRLIFCTWQCMLLWLLSFVDNTVLISEVLRKPSEYL